MPVLFNGQDYKLTLDTGIVLTGATVTRIQYKKPDGTKGFWTATVLGTTIFYDITAIQNNAAGVWAFQSYVEIGGKIFIGEKIYQTILNNIK